MLLVNLYSVLYDAAHLKNIELDNAISIPVKGSECPCRRISLLQVSDSYKFSFQNLGCNAWMNVMVL